MTTNFDTKCDILSEVWLNYRNDEEFEDFISYNDLGLPLAYALANDIAKSTESATRFIDETFHLLLAGLGIDEDRGYETLDEVLGDATN